ncbi:MAG: hypothetical protein JKY13_02595 [Gammaproteobacteria bacterium]|nr:hypothetical protein [Gammaproteobacteria bacterium]
MVGLFANSLLFIPQIVKILKHKSAKDFSLIMFGGFCLIQLALIGHGIIKHDYILLSGYVLSIIACGITTLLIIKYRHR